MTAVIYARYSSDNQREESIEGQLRECKAFAEKTIFKSLVHILTVLSLPERITVLTFRK